VDLTDNRVVPKSTAWLTVFVLLILYALAYFDRQIISLMVSDLKASFGLTDFRISLLQGLSFAVVYGVLGLPLGWAADRLQRRYVILTGVLIWSCAATACGFARTFPELLAARMFVGAGEAAIMPCALSMLSDLFPKRQLTSALSVFVIGGVLGSELSVVLGGMLIHYASAGVEVPILGTLSAWRFAFIAAGLSGLLLAFLIFVVPEPGRRHNEASDQQSWTDLFAFLRKRRLFFLCHFIGFGSILMLSFARASWMPTILARQFDWPMDRIGYVLGTLGSISSVAAFLISGWWVDRWVSQGVRDAHFRLYIAGSVVIFVFGLGGLLMPSAGLMLSAMTIAGLPLTIGAIAASAIQTVTPPRLNGRVYAIYLLFVGTTAMTLGPSIVGALTDFWFHDTAKVHLSLAVCFAILPILAFAAFAIGLRPMREASAQALEQVRS